MTTTTWRKEITECMEEHGDSWDTVTVAIGDVTDLDKPFDAGYGCAEGVPFTVWTPHRIYFPWCYDGAEGCSSVARHPDGVPTEHIGG